MARTKCFKTHRRRSRWHSNCFTVNTVGDLVPGIVLNQYGREIKSIGRYQEQVDFKQGPLRTYKSVEVRKLSDMAIQGDRLHYGTYRSSERCILATVAVYDTLVYVPAFVTLPFGSPYPGDPNELVTGAVHHHPRGRERDGSVALGEAWEDNKTGLFTLADDRYLMLGCRKGKQTRVVTLYTSEHYLIMRYPRSAELAWYVETTQAIRAEERAYNQHGLFPALYA